MKSLITSFIFLCVAFCLNAEEQIVVRLATENQLLPLYLANVNAGSSSFDQAYVDKLEKVLRFDINNNGMTRLAEQSVDKAALVAKESLGGATAWKAFNVQYVIKPQIQGRDLSVQVLAVNTGRLNKIEGITLSGQLGEDRRTIHKLADAIHQELFGTKGIATTRFLYAVRTRPKNKANGESDSTKWVSEIWEADYDGGNPRQITHDNSYNISPSYVPPQPGYTSNSFIYISYQISQPKMFVARLKDGVGQRVSTLGGNELTPAASRQRDKLVFISDLLSYPELFLLPFNPDSGGMGKPYQIHSCPEATQGSPCFSPDGTRVAFVSNKDGSAKIYMMDIPRPGSQVKEMKPTRITKHGKESTAPAWSPDGSKIAYTSMTNGARQIWVYDLDSNEERQLTQGPGHKENPTWAPNSLHLIFNSSTPDASELYLINLNQQESCKISSGAGEKRFPSWEVR
jgi:TolB protein